MTPKKLFLCSLLANQRPCSKLMDSVSLKLWFTLLVRQRLCNIRRSTMLISHIGLPQTFQLCIYADLTAIYHASLNTTQCMLYVRNQFEISSKSNMPTCAYKHNYRVYSHCTAWPNFSILYSLVGYKQANQPGFSFTGLPTRIVKCVLLWEATAAQHHVNILTKTKRNSAVLRSC